MDNIIYSISEEDIQNEAQCRFGRNFTFDEMQIVKKGLDAGLNSTLPIVMNTIFNEMLQ